MKMKSTFLVIAALLFTVLFSQTQGQLGANRPTQCCFSHSAKQIPKKYLHHYVETRSDCSKPGLIFVLKRGVKVCANPQDRWVKDRVRFLDEQFMNNMI
ncbi:C-C motif chemokine 3-like [Polyodon spathula]|uniref:C-C motif chemokine 3-like n=1 Tax=Polyodon spathula TaxID=7913 RepID=UPI001B7EC252|nr:C-C motif chemokine 3-like [Polyodon spathula]